MKLQVELPEDFDAMIEVLVASILKRNGYELREDEFGISPLSKEQIKFEGSKGIIRRVCASCGYEFEQIKVKTRKKEVLRVRQIIHYILDKHTKLTLAEIGYMVGNKNHATVIHSIKTISNLLETDKQFRKESRDLIYLYSL